MLFSGFCLALTLACSSTPAAREVSDGFAAAAQREYDRAVAIRRELHANPELGERETETAALIVDRLEELGLEVRTGIGGTGVVGILHGDLPGGVVAYRADMDALPIAERTGLPFASTRTDTWDGQTVGVMHACGHDMHVAIALGVAAVLARSDVRAELSGTVLFVFQPAEEGLPTPGSHGAKRMVEEGVFSDPRPSAVFGLHVSHVLDLGQVALIPGGALAAVDRFTVRVEGQQTHGAYPQRGVDPIVAISHVVVALQSIVSRNVDTHETAVVTVGKIQGGNRFNVIPESAELVGTIRTHVPAIQDAVHARLKTIVESTAHAFGAVGSVEIERMTPVTTNDVELAARMRPVLAAGVGEANVVPERPHMGGEDFAFFANEVPGFYYFLGVSTPGDSVRASIHTPEFDPREEALAVGIETSARLLARYLDGEAAD